MSKNQEIAKSLLELVGGASNVSDVLHCMTRLRVKVINRSFVQLDKINEVKGVLGAQFAENSLQVVIGPTVDEVYQEFIALSGHKAKGMIDENLDDELLKKKLTPLSVFQNIVNTFASIMTPLIPLFVTMGMVNVIAILIGPTMLKLVSDQSALYTNFTYIGKAITYFLPIFIAITAARQFKTSPMIAVALIGLMLSPDLIAALALKEGYTIYGIAAPNVTYSAQVIPAILVVLGQSYVERLFKRIVPSAIRVIGVPLGTLLVMFPLAFLVLGPAGYYVGAALSSAVIWLYAVAGPVETALLGALSVFMLGFGISRPIFFAVLALFMANKVEYTYMGIAMVLNNWLVCGIAAGYTFKSKTAESRQIGITGLVSNLLGGVSEPIIFGIILPNRKTYLPVLISGGLSGFFLGLMKVGYYQFGPTNFLSVIGFMGGAGNNFLYGCIASGIAFIAAFVSMMFLYRESPQSQLINQNKMAVERGN